MAKLTYCNHLNYSTFFNLEAVRTGLEPATSCVTGRHSNQLNYRTVFFKEAQKYTIFLCLNMDFVFLNKNRPF